MRNNYLDMERSEKSHFDKMAKNYEKNYGYNDKFTKYKIAKKVDKFTSSINEYFSSGEPLSILELGCGTGTYTFEYAKKLPQAKITAMDISDEMIKIVKGRIKKNRNISYKVKSVYKTGFDNESVDVVCGFYILHHLETSLIRKEVFRILKPGGLAFFYEPNILNPWVFIVKSIPFIKRRVGDSPDEWAINPIKIGSVFTGFDTLESSTSEFILPLRFINFEHLKILDKITSFFKYIPVINLFGGSVEILLRKKEN